MLTQSARRLLIPRRALVEYRLGERALRPLRVSPTSAYLASIIQSQPLSSSTLLLGKNRSQHRGKQQQHPHQSAGTGTSRIKDEKSIPGSETRGESTPRSSPSSDQPPQPDIADQVGEELPNGPIGLPDLTKGIPSTLDAEGVAERTTPHDTRQSLNLTEDPSRPLPGGGGGRGGGSLPSSAYVSSFEQRRLRFANRMYAAVLVMSVVGVTYLGRNWETSEEERGHPDAPSGWGLRLFYQRARARIADTMGYYTEPAFPKLLPELDASLEKPYTLVLSLEDLLVHSEWTREHGWRMAKRPGADYFLRYLQQYYELVIFTTLPWTTADPIVRKLDPFRMVMFPLFKDATRYENGEHVKDLSYLNRDLSKVILIDTVPSHAKAQPENAIILPKWNGDPNDKGLVSLIPFLEYMATMGLADTREVLKSFAGKDIPQEFALREAIARKKFEQQLAEERAKHPRRLGKGLLNSVLGVRSGLGPDGTEQSAAEAIEQGKMLQDHIRERGQRNYEALEKEIRENGDKWLAEMAAEEEKVREEEKKKMNVSGMAEMFGGGGSR